IINGVELPKEYRKVTMDDCLTIAILSDLHAYDRLKVSESPPSYLCINDPETELTQHPIGGLLNLIKGPPEISADILICCGDLCDKARPAGISYTWEKLHRLREELKADRLIATPGNHDVDSRFGYNDYDAKGFLQTLEPPF